MRLEWSPFAQADRDAIFDYIEADSPQSAVAVDERIQAQIERLVHFPKVDVQAGLKAPASSSSSEHR